MDIIFGIYWILGILICLVAIKAKPAYFHEKMAKYSNTRVVIIVVTTGLVVIPSLIFNAIKKLFVRGDAI